MPIVPIESAPATPQLTDRLSGDPCILVILGASGDLTRRLLIPAIYNMECDGLLPDQLAIVGMAMDDWTSDGFRDRMAQAIQTFHTRKEFDAGAWAKLAARLSYLPGTFGDAAAFARLHEVVIRLDAQVQARGNLLFYMATPPSVFGLISDNLERAGFKNFPGWKRIIVEKPFGTDLPSARLLNQQILAHWQESQIFRIDHYLGKETVQNILAFRFANGMFEPLWNKQHIDHIQISVSESVTVEGRGSYYDRSGVLRDMIQNHMFQILAYVGMEPPASFEADDIRNEKTKLLKAVRLYSAEEARHNVVSGQYGAGKKSDGSPCPAYRDEPGVNPQSCTETFAAMRLFIDNWRWEGVPIYLRSGKALWKRGTEVVLQFKKAPEALFRGTPVQSLSANRLIFHIQPDQAIETTFQAKTPGPVMRLQPVNMRFSYGQAFRAGRGTGYEVMLYNCMIGDATLFSRTDLVETAWRVAQPLLDAWAEQPPSDFPNYAAGTWGPGKAFDLIERDGRHWFEVADPETLERVPLFKGSDPLFLGHVSMALHPRLVTPGTTILTKGEIGSEMYLICRGEVEILDGNGHVQAVLREGDYFGEIALLLSEARMATVRARTLCNLFVLEKADFSRILRDHQQFAQKISEIARDRYQKVVASEQLLGSS